MSGLPKLWLGPVSHMVIEFFKRNPGINIGVIPSQNQINAKNSYVKKHFSISTPDLMCYLPKETIVMRDHGSEPWSLIQDIRDGITWFHIDPFKQELWGDKTIELINFVNLICPEAKFEIGTEEYIFSYKKNNFDFSRFLDQTSYLTKGDLQFFVVQGGTNIFQNKNTGAFDEAWLEHQIEICKTFGIKTKEHNGDFLSDSQLEKRFKLGLDAINIAPELGYLQTKIALEKGIIGPKDSSEFLSKIISGDKWKRWMGNENFDLSWKNEDLLLSCGHYVWQEWFYDLYLNKKSDWGEVYSELEKEIKRKLSVIENA